MPNFNNAVITKKGLSLNTKVNAGQGGITFTKSATGSGSYPEGTDLSEVADLLERKQIFQFSKKEIQDIHTVVLRTVINNEDLEAGYQIKEFGIYAEDPDDGEILYSIATAVEGQADSLPEYAKNGLVSMTVDSYVSVSSTENVEVIIKPGVYATKDDLDESSNRLMGEINKKSNKYIGRTVTVPAAGWTGDAAPYTNTVAVAGVTATNDISVIPKFDWTQEEAESWTGSMIMSASQAEGSITLKAYGDKPTIDLTVTVLIGDEVKEGA